MEAASDKQFAPVRTIKRTYAVVEDVGRESNDPVARIEAREQRVRENWVAIMDARALKEELRDCYHREGVNHLQNCRELREEWVRRINLPRFGALKTPPQQE